MRLVTVAAVHILFAVNVLATRVGVRARDFVAVSGPDAGDFLERMVSNEVASLEVGGSRRALLLTPKGRVIALLVVWRRGGDDFLLLTEPGLAEPVLTQLLRARFAAKCQIEPEEHTSHVVFGDADGIPNDEYGEPAVEVLDAEPPDELLSEDELERRRIEARTPRWEREIDERVLPAEAGLTNTHVSFTKGCYPGQEPIARLHYRGKANRALRLLELDGAAEPETEVLHGDKAVGRITSSVQGRALAYIRTDVPEDAELTVGGARASIRP
jgi:folate-binding protein YgfZ